MGRGLLFTSRGYVENGSPVCVATAAVKAWEELRDATTGVIDERPVLMQHAGSTPCPTYTSYEAASVGLGQSIADDGTTLGRNRIHKP